MIVQRKDLESDERVEFRIALCSPNTQSACLNSYMKTWPVTSPFSSSHNVTRMQSSSTLAAMQAAEALRAAGADVVDFGAGEPDFDTPDNIKQAATEAMRVGRTKYTSTGGHKELQKAIINFYQREFQTEFQPSEVMGTSGGKQAIFNAVVTLLNPGDECLIPKPYWVTFPEIVVFAGGNPVFIETEETDFLLTAEQVAKSITPRTRLLILNSPSNPSGRVLPPLEFRRIMEMASERGISVISDECYLRFVYSPSEVFSAATLPKETSIESVHCRIVFKDICNDRMASWLFVGASRVD